MSVFSHHRALSIAAALTISTAAVLAGVMAVPAFAKEKGSAAPNCKLQLLDGKASTSISQLRGKVLYVDFWASWCIPCAVSFPFMNMLDKELSGKGLQVVAINLDEKADDAKKFLTKHPLRFSIAVKANESCAKEFGVQGMPSSFIIDRKGVIGWFIPASSQAMPANFAALSASFWRSIDMNIPCSSEAPSMFRRLLTGIASAIAMAIATGCAEVDPWQRGTLAKPHMALDPNPRINKLSRHVAESREAASGGSESTGGGCGCN